MLITEEQAQSRLNNPNNLANRFSGNRKLVPVSKSSVGIANTGDIPQSELTIIPKPAPGKRTELTPETKTAIAILSRGGQQTQAEIAADFGTSQAEVSNLKIGKTSSGIDKEKVEQALTKVRDAALDKLMLSMGLIDKEKLQDCSASQLSIVASNLSRVATNTLPRDANPGPMLQLVIHAPTIRQENSYKTIEVDG